jgi:hypothetical protein
VHQWAGSEGSEGLDDLENTLVEAAMSEVMVWDISAGLVGGMVVVGLVATDGTATEVVTIFTTMDSMVITPLGTVSIIT